MHMITIVPIFVAATILCLYGYLKRTYNYWKERQVPYIEPNLLFGNSVNMILGRVPTPIEHLNLHRRLAPYPYAGLYMLQKPELLIRDAELIKRILTKDFANFRDRGIKFDYQLDPLARHLFGLNGSMWKRLRAKLTCTFTSARMRSMFPLIEECASEMVTVLNTNLLSLSTVEMKDALSRYATDVIGSCAFGLHLGAIENSNSNYRNVAAKISVTRFRVLIPCIMPWLPRWLIRFFKMNFIDPEVSDFIIKLVKDTIEYRETNRIARNDFLDLLINLRHEQQTVEHDNKLDMTIELIAAQCFLFICAGFDDTSNVLSFFFFEIAKHPEVQNRVASEICEILKSNGGKLTYELLHEMKYTDMVLNETMRMYPPITMISRQCAENFRLSNSDLVIPKGMQIAISIIGLHYDEKYYRKPYVFNPENFLTEELQKRHPYAFIPFGEGPRQCIAKRFAVMQMKTAIVHLIQNYEFRLSEKTKLPLAYKHFGVLTPKDGIWLQYRRREEFSP